MAGRGRKNQPIRRHSTERACLPLSKLERELVSRNVCKYSSYTVATAAILVRYGQCFSLPNYLRAYVGIASEILDSDRENPITNRIRTQPIAIVPVPITRYSMHHAISLGFHAVISYSVTSGPLFIGYLEY